MFRVQGNNALDTSLVEGTRVYAFSQAARREFKKQLVSSFAPERYLPSEVLEYSLILQLDNKRVEIEELLDSLYHQNHPPAELYILDSTRSKKVEKKIEAWVLENQASAWLKLVCFEGSLNQTLHKIKSEIVSDIIVFLPVGESIERFFISRLLMPFDYDSRTDLVSGIRNVIAVRKELLELLQQQVDLLVASRKQAQHQALVVF